MYYISVEPSTKKISGVYDDPSNVKSDLVQISDKQYNDIHLLGYNCYDQELGLHYANNEYDYSSIKDMLISNLRVLKSEALNQPLSYNGSFLDISPEEAILIEGECSLKDHKGDVIGYDSGHIELIKKQYREKYTKILSNYNIIKHRIERIPDLEELKTIKLSHNDLYEYYESIQELIETSNNPSLDDQIDNDQSSN